MQPSDSIVDVNLVAVGVCIGGVIFDFAAVDISLIIDVIVDNALSLLASMSLLEFVALASALASVLLSSALVSVLLSALASVLA